MLTKVQIVGDDAAVRTDLGLHHEGEPGDARGASPQKQRPACLGRGTDIQRLTRKCRAVGTRHRRVLRAGDAGIDRHVHARRRQQRQDRAARQDHGLPAMRSLTSSEDRRVGRVLVQVIGQAAARRPPKAAQAAEQASRTVAQFDRHRDRGQQPQEGRAVDRDVARGGGRAAAQDIDGPQHDVAGREGAALRPGRRGQPKGQQTCDQEQQDGTREGGRGHRQGTFCRWVSTPGSST